jgi:diguanylate cyclase (GGDEF)-like protein
MMMDIDYFKHVNDTYGHLSGDQVLKVLSQVSQSVNRQTDILARLGGEEFAVFMPDTSQAEAVEVAERLRLALANTAMTLPEGQSIHITVSIGVTSIQATDSHIDDLLKRADAALYAAKNSGRNRVCQTETT